MAIPRCYPNLAELTPVCECPAAPPGSRDSGYRTAENGAGKLYAVGYSGYGWSSSIPTGSGNARYLHFNYGFLARMDSKTPGGRAADFTLEPGRAQPSRGESISFLSPARAAGAPTFCDATESRQRTQPRGLSPPGLSPAFFGPLPRRKFGPSPTPRAAPPPCGPPPAGKSYELRRVARPARGGGGSRDPTGRRFSTCRPIPRHPPPKTTQPNGHWPRAWAIHAISPSAK